MPAPTEDDVAALLNTTPNADQVDAALHVVSALAKSYTRGAGWDDAGEPADDLAAVILTATIRLLTNPTQIQSESMGPFAVQYGNNFQGWSTAELATLNRYRVRAQ